MDNQVFRIDLQFHPFSGSNYGLMDVLRVMKERELNGLAVLTYGWNKKTSFDLLEETYEVKGLYDVEIKDCVYYFSEKKSGELFCLIAGQEVATLDKKWHFLSVGAVGIQSKTKPEEMINQILSKGALAIIDHPFVSARRNLGDIIPEEELQLISICEKYKGKIALEWNAYCLPWLRSILPGCSNVNRKTENLAAKLGIPLIGTTDLHAENKSLLRAMGTCFIEIPFREIDFSNLLFSLKKNIFSFNFISQREYVSFFHFIRAFGLPILKEKIAGR